MNGLDLVESEQWLIGQFFGVDHPFLRINKATIIYTWITLDIITLFLVAGRSFLSRKKGVGTFIILKFISFFVDLIKQSLPVFSMRHFVFITTTFCFVFACNAVALIPWMEEPTIDLNTTLAFGLIAFLYAQWTSITTGGLWAYIKGYFSPFFIMFPLNVVGRLATIVSISFRLFGNIFGGSIISGIYLHAIQGHFLWEIVGIISGMNILITLFFGLFEGFLQAFVFGMLSLTYLSLALQGEGH